MHVIFTQLLKEKMGLSSMDKKMLIVCIVVFIVAYILAIQLFNVSSYFIPSLKFH